MRFKKQIYFLKYLLLNKFHWQLVQQFLYRTSCICTFRTYLSWILFRRSLSLLLPFSIVLVHKLKEGIRCQILHAFGVHTYSNTIHSSLICSKLEHLPKWYYLYPTKWQYRYREDPWQYVLKQSWSYFIYIENYYN